jgi:hypothetical protein
MAAGLLAAQGRMEETGRLRRSGLNPERVDCFSLALAGGAGMVPVASSCHRPPVEQFTGRR